MNRKAKFLVAGSLIGATAVIGVAQIPLLAGGAANAAAPDTYRQLNLFGEIFERIRADYVEVPEESVLIEAAINGMLSALDPHSAYMAPDAYSDQQVEIRGAFGGLGLEVTMEDGTVRVVTPMDDSPAGRAGVMTGDLIVEIDGESLQGLSLDQSVEKMRGPVNTPVRLTVIREGADLPLYITVVRDVIRLQSVRYRAEGDDIGYMRISSFTEQTIDGLNRAVERLTAEIGPGNVKGFILDLRNNPGGLLDQAIGATDAFLERGEVMSTRGRYPEQTQRFSARPGDLTNGAPIIVLINGGSASASEIVAGALQDHLRATVLGTRSFGKGSVQTIIPLGPNGAMRLTTARYYTPSGRSIQAVGIVPDIEVIQELPEELRNLGIEARGEASLRGHLGNEDGEATGSLAYVPPNPANDVQLQYALSLLRGTEVNENFRPGTTSAAQLPAGQTPGAPAPTSPVPN
ncbi:MAG: S41 family peptidase [Bauldia sp.]|nr:S41 family peptidase [Bauldia sp.]